MYKFVPFAQLKWLCKFFPTPFGGPSPGPPGPPSDYAYRHNSLHFPFSPVSSLPVPLPFFSYLHITNPLPDKVLAAKYEGTVSLYISPAGPGGARPPSSFWCILK